MVSASNIPKYSQVSFSPSVLILSVSCRLPLFITNSLMSSMYIWRFIFSCNLVSLYPAVHFLNMWLSGSIAIINSNGGGASPWNIPLWIFVSVKLFYPAVKFTPDFHGFLVYRETRKP